MLIPANLYGPNDSFDLDHCHVLSALVKRFTDALKSNKKSITLWGTGTARREFMHVDDLAQAVLYILQKDMDISLINIGWGTDISIKELAELIAKKIGFSGNIQWDTSKPDGMLKKCMSVKKMEAIGYNPIITLSEGIDQMIDLYRQQLMKA